MNRRRAILLGGSALATALAGCLGDDVDVDFDDPEAVTEAWLMSLAEPNYNVMEAVVHENIQRGTPLDFSREERRDWAGTLEQYDRTVQQTSITEQAQGRVVVEAEITDQTLDAPVTGTVSYVLRTEDGDWKIYDNHEIDINEMGGAM